VRKEFHGAIISFFPLKQDGSATWNNMDVTRQVFLTLVSFAYMQKFSLYWNTTRWRCSVSRIESNARQVGGGNCNGKLLCFGLNSTGNTGTEAKISSLPFFWHRYC